MGSRQQLSKVQRESIIVGDSEIKPFSSVCNLGAWFDKNLSISIHVRKVCSKVFHGLYSIRQMEKYLSEDATKVLVHAFVTSHLDYCNSLLYGIPKYQHGLLQRILNAAAWIVFLVSKFSHITPLLCNLHWLPVYSSTYVSLVCPLSHPEKLLSFKESGPYNLRSNTSYETKVPPPPPKKKWRQGFHSCWPPSATRSIRSVQGFGQALKTFLFRLAFAQWTNSCTVVAVF